MREWQAVRRDTAATDWASLSDARNVSLQIDGEVGRRNAYSAAVAAAGVQMIGYRDPFGNHYALLVDSSGNLKSEAL